MEEKIIIAGSGGQGILLLGKIIAECALRENKYVTWFPSYGAEVRGGTAYCMVIISDEEISSPYIEQADTLIAMNALALEKFKKRIKNNGLVLVNSSLVPQKLTLRQQTLLQFPFTDIALTLGNIKVANTVALGCYLAHKKIIAVESVLKVIAAMAPPDRRGLIEINKQAILAGKILRA